MTKIFLFLFILTGCTPQAFQASQMQESIMITNGYKIIEHGHFVFLSVDENDTIIETVVSYSLNLKEKTFSISCETRTISVDLIDKSYLNGFSNSEDWNKKGSALFLIFHPDFFKWNNAAKRDFFLQTCESSKKHYIR